MIAFRGPDSDAADLMAHHARTFYFATSFLTPDHRASVVRLYAFFRTLDDLVDERPHSGADDIVIEREIDAWNVWINDDLDRPAPRPEIGVGLASVIRTHRIPSGIFVDFLNGLRSDLRWSQPETVEDLTHYSYQVASTVGLAMTHVFAAASPAALDAASRLGIAMQWTNILRDVGGDLERGRVYMPKEELARYSLSVDNLVEMWRARSGPDARLRSLMAQEVRRADVGYAAGLDGIRLLPGDARLPIFVASILYQRILRALEGNGYDSLRERVSTSRREKIGVASRAVMRLVARGDEHLHKELK